MGYSEAPTTKGSTMDDTQNETSESVSSAQAYTVLLTTAAITGLIFGIATTGGMSAYTAAEERFKKFRKDRAKKKLTLVKD